MEAVTIIILPPFFPLCSYFRQLGDLDESLEVDHLFGSIEKVLKPGGQKKERDAFALVPRAAGTGSGKIKLQSFHRY